MGQPPLGVALGGPGVAEIEVDALHLAGREKLRQVRAASASMKNTLLSSSGLLARSMAMTMASGTRSTATKRHIRLRRRRLAGEAALAAAQLQAQLLRAGHQLPPVAPLGLGVSGSATGRRPPSGARDSSFSFAWGNSPLVVVDVLGLSYHSFPPLSAVLPLFLSPPWAESPCRGAKKAV